MEPPCAKASVKPEHAPPRARECARLRAYAAQPVSAEFACLRCCLQYAFVFNQPVDTETYKDYLTVSLAQHALHRSRCRHGRFRLQARAALSRAIGRHELGCTGFHSRGEVPRAGDL